jgi:uncharacterized phage infection (PIP) family protein YhgE
MENDEMLVLIKSMFEEKTNDIQNLFEEKTNDIQNLFEEKVEEVKRHSAIMYESIENKIQTVAEGHDILNRKIDGLDKKVDQLDKKIESSKEELSKRMNKAENELSIIKEYIIGVDEKLNEHDRMLRLVK